MKNVVIVAKKGRITIPVWLRKKYKIEEGTAFVIVETEEGILFKPIKSIWDMVGSGSQFATPERSIRSLTDSGNKTNSTILKRQEDFYSDV